MSTPDVVLVRLERAAVTLEDHGRRLHELERVQPAVVAQEVRELRADIAELSRELDAVRKEMRDGFAAEREEHKATRRSFYAVVASVTGAAITFAFTAFQVWGTTP